MSARGFRVMYALPRSAANSRYRESAMMSRVETNHTMIAVIQMMTPAFP